MSLMTSGRLCCFSKKMCPCAINYRKVFCCWATLLSFIQTSHAFEWTEMVNLFETTKTTLTYPCWYLTMPIILVFAEVQRHGYESMMPNKHFKRLKWIRNKNTAVTNLHDPRASAVTWVRLNAASEGWTAEKKMQQKKFKEVFPQWSYRQTGFQWSVPLQRLKCSTFLSYFSTLKIVICSGIKDTKVFLSWRFHLSSMKSLFLLCIV